jgi:mono/diheme cytochrome c family protein
VAGVAVCMAALLLSPHPASATGSPGPSTSARNHPVQQQPAASASDAAAGEQLFLGRKAFQNGGPACSDCHGISNLSVSHGPTPGADLTHEYSKLGPEALTSLLEQPPFPPMDVLYKKSPLTAQEQRQLIAFLQREDQAKTDAAPAAPAPPTPEAIASGKALFMGRARMQNGGPACATCHTAAGIAFPYGGTMGPDLTKEYSKLGPQGLTVSLKTLYFPAMTALFQNRPLTATEQQQLAAFFQSIDQRKPPASPTRALVMLSVVVLAGLFFWTWLAVGRRRVRSVRQKLLEQAGLRKGNR